MTNYIDPFKKRTFSERFKAVFAFIKQSNRNGLNILRGRSRFEIVSLYQQ